MKKSKTFWPAHFLVLLAGCVGYATAAPYGSDGRATSFTQPNGQALQLRVFGDNYYARTETPAGFTVVYNETDGAYYYAQLAANGKSLVPLATPADEPAPAGLEPHIDLSAKVIQDIADANHSKYDGDRNKIWSERIKALQQIRNAGKGAELRGAEAANAKIKAAPVLGNKRGLTIIVQFPNDNATAGADPVDFPTNRAKIVRFCNKAGYTEDGNTGSVRDYFYDQSLGLMTYTQTVTEIVTMPRPRNYYNYSDYPTNRVLGNTSSRVLISDALTVLKNQGFDFSGLTVDAANNAVATNVFFAGPDSGVFARGLWPQSWSLASPVSVGTPTDPVFISRFQITNIDTSSPVIGTFCHENGHLLLGYPDIYARSGEGVGEHCLMGSGNYLNGGKTPSPINGYFKNVVGWGNVTDLAPDEFKTANLPTTGNVAYRVINPSVATEYFLVENRGPGDKWAEFSDDKGIAIWHIDETIDGNFNIGNNHYGIALEQADGKQDLENGRNRGDGGDLFDLASPRFTDKTNPDAKWWDGKKSSVDVEVLSGIAKSTTVAFGGVPPNTIIVGSPNGGEVLFRESAYPITWKANVKGNVKIDLFKGGKFLTNLSPNEPNDGVFTWLVSKNLGAVGNYTIRISSVSNATPTTDFSDADFSITDATFPPGKGLPDGWFKPKFAKSIWKVTKKVQFEGPRSLVSGAKTPDGKASAIGYRSDFNSGYVSFYIKVSSEQGFDFARFYIDGVAQTFKAGTAARGLSGNVPWTFYQFPVSAGKHTFIWSYEKDDTFAGQQDSAWIDGVTLPAGTQDIAIEQPKGKDLVSGTSKRVFPPTAKGTSSRPFTFTITNLGKAKLTGLKIKNTGKNSTEFVVVKDLKKTSLKKGQSTTFEVVFRPKDFGRRVGGLRILSNDADEGKFDIALQGTGLGTPEIAVSQPSDNPLADGDTRNFGIAFVGSEGDSKTFTITNSGSAVLDQLKVRIKGTDKDDFLAGPLGVIVLDPGDSTTFKVSFNPRKKDIRNAKLVISSNDPDGDFTVKLTGKGSPKVKAGVAPIFASSSGSIVDAVLGSTSGAPQSTTSVDVVDGSKYLSLTVAKNPAGVSPGVVEVSSNLLDWYSGNKHTTVVIDNATTLKVRDNTPVTQDAKRYIRLK